MDSLRVEQALTNLVDNAVRHGGGDVTVTAVRRNGSFELHVLDEGAGFPAAFLAHPFERFSRADPALPDGSGLGLAIVETIAGRTAARPTRPTAQAGVQTCGSRCPSALCDNCVGVQHDRGRR